MPSLAPPSLVLASRSPRRAALLGDLGFHLTIAPPDIDERARRGEAAAAYVKRIAREKADAVARSHPGQVVLAADTSVVLGGRLLGKPRDAAEARRMLRALAGREHQVVTGVWSHGPARSAGLAVRTAVRFRALSAREIAWYVGSGEPMDKAGAYGIQGLAGAFVSAIRGSYSNVVGLPLAETLALLTRVGQRLPWEAP